jgi:hypothetical protein
VSGEAQALAGLIRTWRSFQPEPGALYAAGQQSALRDCARDLERVAGPLADRVHGMIVAAKAVAVELEDLHLALTTAAGRPAGTGPAVNWLIAQAEEEADQLAGLIRVILADNGVNPDDDQVAESVTRRLEQQARLVKGQLR